MQNGGRKIEYSRKELLDINISIQKKLSPDLWKNIKGFGLEKVKPTRRGKRAGRSRTDR